ncbi:phosphoenolpyruvate hydrolase family protein [Fervidibacillus halotolerans]|uniref:Phosphoenolpyruvate hydrolase family protein n=1 Tax=Fervidibacillus halotolerans TaxID=2980027 RepID=A0A9E8M2S9_9BACI|nr:phosphoenolpyruvate hydrolase family protein [Fervidibacillus halotolerans]WAA13374.1 phosphoenolpyruvate hydrolase family protein [Fervidibacillus halotolerans]
MNKKEIRNRLHNQMKEGKHLIGVAAGSGLTGKYAQKGGADFLLALTSGRFRQMGVSSSAGYLPIANSNENVMNFAVKELLPLSNQIPVIFGLMANDPTIHLRNYISTIQKKGFSGINNFPTVGLIDGKFREALEEQHISYAKEVEAISIANSLGLFTVAFVFNKDQAIQMVKAGADVICVHFGFTKGGILGPKHVRSLQSAKTLALEIFEACEKINSNIIKMIYGGPVTKPADVQFMYNGTDIHGYIGGSVFERIPSEQMILQVTKSFKETDEVQYEQLSHFIMDGFTSKKDYIDFIKNYIRLHYADNISLNDLAEYLGLSRSYLSTLFKEEVGTSFRDYLIEYRINLAIDILKTKILPLTTVAEMVGYPDYAQFSKLFKKKLGMSPKEFAKRNKNTKT